jgi:hypothetical protein
MSSDDFFRRIEARAPGVQRATAGEPSRTFEARLSSAEGQGVVGRLRTREVDGHESLRELAGPSCAEVAEALALIAAVAIRRPDAEPAAPVKPTEPPRPTPPDESPERSVFLLSCGVTGSARTGVLPATPLFGIALSCEAVRDAGVRPSVGLAAEQTLTANASTDEAVPASEMSARLTLGRLSVSPISSRTGRLELRPSATLEVGRITASGSGPGLGQPGDNQGVWATAGVLGRAAFDLGKNLRLELGLGGNVPLKRYTFEFRQGVEAYRMAAIGFFGAASFSVGLP